MRLCVCVPDMEGVDNFCALLVSVVSDVWEKSNYDKVWRNLVQNYIKEISKESKKCSKFKQILNGF